MVALWPSLYLNIHTYCQLLETTFPVLFFSITSVPLCRFPLPFKLTVRSHLDLHYAFLPNFTRHIDNRTCTDSLFSSTTVSPLLWSTGSVFPITQPLPFSPTSHLIPHSSSSSRWRSKWRQRSSLLSSSSVAKLDACSIRRYLLAVKPPALESQCADLLLICGISDSPTTGLFIQEEQEGNPHYKLCQGHGSHHTNLQASAQTYTYILFTSIAPNI